MRTEEGNLRQLFQEIREAITNPPDWFGKIVLVVWGLAALGLALAIFSGAASVGLTVSLIAACFIAPWLIYYVILFGYLAAVFSFALILQLIAWAGRAWRGEPIFSEIRRHAVQCKQCGRAELVDFDRALQHGWPKCCGQTMAYVRPQ
jgi:hypothetical protein